MCLAMGCGSRYCGYIISSHACLAYRSHANAMNKKNSLGLKLESLYIATA